MKKSFIFKGLTHFDYIYKIELNEKEKSMHRKNMEEFYV